MHNDSVKWTRECQVNQIFSNFNVFDEIAFRTKEFDFSNLFRLENDSMFVLVRDCIAREKLCQKFIEVVFFLLKLCHRNGYNHSFDFIMTCFFFFLQFSIQLSAKKKNYRIFLKYAIKIVKVISSSSEIANTRKSKECPPQFCVVRFLVISYLHFFTSSLNRKFCVIVFFPAGANILVKPLELRQPYAGFRMFHIFYHFISVLVIPFTLFANELKQRIYKTLFLFIKSSVFTSVTICHMCVVRSQGMMLIVINILTMLLIREQVTWYMFLVIKLILFHFSFSSFLYGKHIISNSTYILKFVKINVYLLKIVWLH